MFLFWATFLAFILLFEPQTSSLKIPKCNDEPIFYRENLASVIVTGTALEVSSPNYQTTGPTYNALIKVYRVLKGKNIFSILPPVHHERNRGNTGIWISGFGNTKICDRDLQVNDTRIFLLGYSQGENKLTLNSSLVVISLSTIRQTELALKDSEPEDHTSCTTLVCPFGTCVDPSEQTPEATCSCHSTPKLTLTSYDPVCGVNGRVYNSLGVLRRAACEARAPQLRETSIIWCRHNLLSLEAVSQLCEPIRCSEGGRCVYDYQSERPICLCPTTFDLCGSQGLDDPVCGSNNVTYPNECLLRHAACETRGTITFHRRGRCDEQDCTTLNCAPYQNCIIDELGKPVCVCPICEAKASSSSLCGEDGVTYASECHLKRHNCYNNTTVSVDFLGICDPCANVTCPPYAACLVFDGQAECHCPECSPPKEEVEKPSGGLVCGSDGHTYKSECDLQYSACSSGEGVTVLQNGGCTGSCDPPCVHGAVCSRETNECTCDKSTCYELMGPVCGSDRKTYATVCSLREAHCRQQQAIRIVALSSCEQNEQMDSGSGSGYMRPDTEGGDSGTTDMVVASPVPSMSPTPDKDGDRTPECNSETCSYGGYCNVHTDKCLCVFDDSENLVQFICGSDGNIYENYHELKRKACLTQNPIEVESLRYCRGYNSSLIEPCLGRPPLYGTNKNSNILCSNGAHDCPSNAFCHRTSTHYSLCCSKDPSYQRCQGSQYGCCPDTVTNAPGPHHQGCPSTCQCHQLGSNRHICDPDTSQCDCKPGVHGQRCDACAAGFYGLRESGHSVVGCKPCSCHPWGSHRPDCNQMTGRCMCYWYATGLKCDRCSNPSYTLSATGCLKPKDDKILLTCEDIDCEFGFCIVNEETGLPYCSCSGISCQSSSPKFPVCGSDGVTYGSQCLLVKASCKLQNQGKLPIALTKNISCQEEPSYLNYLSDQPFRASKSKNLALPIKLRNKNVAHFTLDSSADLSRESYFSTPHFDGISYVELKPSARHRSRFSLTIRFIPESPTGVLLLMDSHRARDFLSLVLNDGFVIFRFDNGHGTAVIKSSESILIGVENRVQIMRNLGTEGVLRVNSQHPVRGKARGSATHLDVGQGSILLGGIGQQLARINRSPQLTGGILAGLQGCITSVKEFSKETKTYNLTYPSVGSDIISRKGVVQCTLDVCSEIKCKNGGRCVIVGDGRHTCRCSSSYTGDSCEIKKTHSKRQLAESRSAVFHTHSYLLLNVFRNRLPLYDLSVTVWFKSETGSGLVVFGGDIMDKTKDHFMLYLSDGRIHFEMDLGSGPFNTFLPDIVSLHSWHSMALVRRKRTVGLSLDDGNVFMAAYEGDWTQLNIPGVLYVGGLPAHKHHYRHIPGFTGSIYRLQVQSSMIDDLVGESSAVHDVSELTSGPCNPNPCSSAQPVCIPKLLSFECIV